MEVPLDQGKESSKSSSSKGGLRTMPFIIGTFSLSLYVCVYISPCVFDLGVCYVHEEKGQIFLSFFNLGVYLWAGFLHGKRNQTLSLFQLRCLCLLLTWKRVVQKGQISPSRPLPTVLGHVGV